MQVFGHRGAAGLAPENTLKSFREALACGVDGVEFDVRCSADGLPVVVHDADVDRTTSATGRVIDFTAEELRLRGIPTVREVLEEVGRSAKINVELKDRDASIPTLRTLLASRDSGVIDDADVLVTSFEIEALRDIRHFDSRLATGLLTRGLPGLAYWRAAEELSAVAANIDLASAQRDFVLQSHRLGMRVMVYTVNSVEDAERMQAIGVDVIFTDFPNVVRRT